MTPAWQQARNVAAAVRHLAPELADLPDSRILARKPSVFESSAAAPRRRPTAKVRALTWPESLAARSARR